MPRRSSGSVKIRSADPGAIERALAAWADRLFAERPEVLRVGYFGSFARRTHGPASDLDILLVLRESAKPPHRRILDYPVEGVPVGCEVFPFTQDEIERKAARPGWMRTVLSEVRWVRSRA